MFDSVCKLNGANKLILYIHWYIVTILGKLYILLTYLQLCFSLEYFALEFKFICVYTQMLVNLSDGLYH